MALSRDIQTLRQAELFSVFSDEQLRLIAFTVSRITLEASHVLFEENTASDGAYLVERGMLGLDVAGHSGGIAGPGSLLAEVALISDIPHRHSARANEATEVLFIQRDQFLRLIEEYADIADEMDRRLRKSFAEMVSALNSVKTRLSDF